MDGRVQFVDRDAWHDVLPPIYDRYRLSQPGAVTRNERYWKLRLRDVPRHRHGASALFAAAYSAPDGTPEGYVLYRVKGSWEHGFAQNRVTMSDLITCTPAAHAALWKFCLNLDLVTAVTGYGTPDEPLRWMLADPRRLTARSYGDNIWVRLIDIPAALAGRRYRTADRLVLRVQDRFCPENSGTYVVESEMEGATCRSTAAAPDLELEVADLGAAYLGGVRFSTLAQAGRVQECHPGARGRADAMFAAERDPICRTDF
jgi:predicted acetyltransferase